MEDSAGPHPDEQPAASLAETVERYHQLARTTQNTMYAWYALQAIFWARSPAEQPFDQDLTVPAWIADMLQTVTCNLTTLCDGIDPRTEFVSPDLPDCHSPEEAWNHPDWIAAARKRLIDHDKAMELVPLALGLTREEGWNAFASFKTTTRKMQEFRHYEALKEDGVSSRNALDRLREAFVKGTDRTLYARIKEGRKHALGETKKPKP